MITTNLHRIRGTLHPKWPRILIEDLSQIDKCEADRYLNCKDERPVKFGSFYEVIEKPNYEFVAAAEVMRIMPKRIMYLFNLVILDAISCLLLDFRLWLINFALPRNNYLVLVKLVIKQIFVVWV